MSRAGVVRGTILLAEDEPNVMFTLKTVLEDAGFHVQAVPSFAQACRSMQETSFDAVITEIGLENGDLGLELAKEAKKLSRPPAVMIYTGNPTVDRLRRALKLRVDYIAFKPGDVQEITNALFRLITRRAMIATMS